MTISLPDVNFWLALAAEGHTHHKGASEWFAAQPTGSVAFCRVTQMGLFRLLTNASVMGNAARTISQAWEIYAALKSEPRVIFLTEPKDVEAVWNELMSQKGVGPSSWTDAYLAAFAQAHSSTLTTFDAAFVRWTTMKVTILT